MRVVYKYIMPDNGRLTIPAGRVRHVAAQNRMDPTPSVWVEHEMSTTYEFLSPAVTYLHMFGTGHPIEGVNLEFVGSAVCAGGGLVWHVYEAVGR